MARVGLIDVDGHNFPNLPLMKLSAWHKQIGDDVVWYSPLEHGFPQAPLDKVYMSKVFSFTSDYPYYVNAKEIVKGGSGYCISLADGRERYDTSKDAELPCEIETIYPDYGIYYDKIAEVQDTAYGFLTRGCPNGCDYCHVGCKEGRRSIKVADLDTFWQGQKNIVLLDPNITACKDWKELFQQLIDSGAWVDFSQGLDIRLMTKEKVEMMTRIRTKSVHFAWDRYEDKEIVIPRFKMFKELTGWDKRKLTVYVLVNFNTTIEQDLERIYTLRDLGYWPYVMVYNKGDFIINDKAGRPVKMKSMRELLKKYEMDKIQHFDTCWNIQRWVNMRAVFERVKDFKEYKAGSSLILR